MARADGWVALLVLAAGLAGAGVSRADDWAQFRKDANHSGASNDPVRLPFGEVWSWTPVNGHTGLFQAAISHGRIFFISYEDTHRFLVSADAKTGLVAWKQPLTAQRLSNSYSDTVGPAVSDDGTVFVYDEVTLPKMVPIPPRYFDSLTGVDESPREGLRASLLQYARAYFGLAPVLQELPPGLRVTKLQGGGVTFAASLPALTTDPFHHTHNERVIGEHISFKPAPCVIVRTFSAVAGQSGPALFLEPWINSEFINYTALLHPPFPHAFGILRSDAWTLPDNVGLGPPVLAGGELFATTTSASLLEWRLPTALRPAWMQHTVVHHPVGGTELINTPFATLSGFPPLVFPQGVMLGDDQTHRFLGLLSSQSGVADWHADIQGTVGIPASDGSRAYLGLNGPGANQMIVCLDPGSGAVRWRYAPAGEGGDPQKVERGVWMASGGLSGANSSQMYLGSHAVQLKTRKGEPLKYENRDIVLNIPEMRSATGPGPFQFKSPLSGCWVNAGLAVTATCICGEAARGIVALERDTGAVRWRVSLDPHLTVRSLIATQKHLFLCVSRGAAAREPLWLTGPSEAHALLALRLEDGKTVWEESVARPGQLMAADGMVFLANGGLHAYGPAERTFSMASDSSGREDYLLRPLPETQPDGDGDPRPAVEGSRPATASPPASMPMAPPEQKPAPSLPEVADAAVLRLSAGDPRDQLVTRCKARRELVPSLPLLVTLDPLNATRETWLPFGDQPALGASWNTRYAELCSAVAAAGRPDYLEVLPDMNAYLVRNMERVEQLRALIHAVTEAVHHASPATKVVVALNAEVLNGSYGRGDYRPFGKLPAADPRTVEPSLTLAATADVVGLTAYPQSGTARASSVPSNYLLSIRMRLGEKPVLVTRLVAVVDEELEPKSPGPQREQAVFLGRLLQNCYWLDTPLVAYPEVISTGKNAPAALRKADGERPALSAWQQVLRWKRVEKLTLLKTPREEEAPTKPE